MPTRTPLISAVLRKDVPTIKTLLSQGHDPNQPDSEDVTPLIHAADTSSEIVKILIKAGANVNYRSSTNGYTPLFVAEHSSRPDSVDLLKTAGATVV